MRLLVCGRVEGAFEPDSGIHLRTIQSSEDGFHGEQAVQMDGRKRKVLNGTAEPFFNFVLHIYTPIPGD
jgi:hypothetical protein